MISNQSVKENISRCLKDDLQWYTVFIADFRLLHIISALTATPTWVQNYQGASLTALYNLTFFFLTGKIRTFYRQR